jgi:hypothetical protein
MFSVFFANCYSVRYAIIDTDYDWLGLLLKIILQKYDSP